MFQPTASIETLRQRALICQRVRRFFDDRGFFEVDTPVLSHDIVVDRYLAPISIEKSAVTNRDESGQRLWLQTSPEFAMKRLLAAGAEAIYQIAHAFRASESGTRHNPEFSMLEWYRVGDDLESGMELLSEFACAILPCDSVEKISYQSAFETFAGIDPLAADVDAFRQCVSHHGLDSEAFQDETDLDVFRNLLLSEVVESRLGVSNPTIVFDWPESQSALAVVRPSNPPVAERFELYVDGVELANGYHELLDADELVRRNLKNNQLRQQDGNEVLPGDSKLIAAMRHGMPACSGVAMGVDRLVMIALQTASISDVIPFPLDRA